MTAFGMVLCMACVHVVVLEHKGPCARQHLDI
jgi:hypothetical protein